MNTDDLLIAPSSKIEYIPLLDSSTAETPKLNTSISSELVIKGKRNTFNLFSNCYSLSVTSVTFSDLTTISDSGKLINAFVDCSKLTSVSFPKLTTISGEYAMDNAFYYCEQIPSVSFPKLTTVTHPKSAFYQAATSSVTIHLPKALSSLGITNNGSSNSANYCSFAYDL